MGGGGGGERGYYYLNRLCTEFGVSGKVLDWFASYLSDRFQKMTVDGVLSDRFKILGFPKAVAWVLYYS